MLVNNPIHNACNYATDSEYLTPPDSEQVRRGVVPLDSLPADWWNFFIKDASDGINEAHQAIQDYISEVRTLITAAKIPENQECKDRIFCAIDVLRQTIATASLAGAVKSSDVKGQVSVNKDTGIMTANGVGNAEFTNLDAISGAGTKSYGTVTEAIKGTREETINVFTSVKGDINTLKNSKAPTNHASAETTYGVGSADIYGHLRISDEYKTLVSGDGIAASQKSINEIYKMVANSGVVPYNGSPAALGVANSGTSSQYARGDHVHPMPTCIACAGGLYEAAYGNWSPCYGGSGVNNPPWLVSWDTDNRQLRAAATNSLCVAYASRAAETDRVNWSGSITSTDWIAAWDGSGVVRAISPSNTSVGYANSASCANYANSANCAIFACCLYYSVEYTCGGGSFDAPDNGLVLWGGTGQMPGSVGHVKAHCRYSIGYDSYRFIRIW